MKKLRIKSLLPFLLLAAIIVVAACKEDDPDDPTNSPEDYNRVALLTNMANNYIVPAYQAYKTETENLNSYATSFVAAPSIPSLAALRAQWKIGLLTWQDVSFLEFGPAEGISLRAQTNIYPADTTVINSNILGGSYNLQLPANFVAKGFQAIDFLLHRPGMTDQDLVDFYTNTPNAGIYLTDITEELMVNATSVHDQWVSSYATSFINNGSSNAQGTSVSDIVNALSLHYEGFVRKGKVGLPAGVFNGFSQLPMPDHVEAYYSGESLPYASRVMEAISKYVLGEGYSNGINGEGIDNYLLFVSAKSSGEDLSTVIDNQISTITSNLNGLNDPFSNEVTGNVIGVSSTYQSMQALVPLIKVDMTSALGVLVTYQDSDGD